MEIVAQKLIDELKNPIEFTYSEEETRQVSIGSIGIAFFLNMALTLMNWLKSQIEQCMMLNVGARTIILWLSVVDLVLSRVNDSVYLTS